jgi:hypothetical protein
VELHIVIIQWRIQVVSTGEAVGNAHVIIHARDLNPGHQLSWSATTARPIMPYICASLIRLPPPPPQCPIGLMHVTDRHQSTEFRVTPKYVLTMISVNCFVENELPTAEGEGSVWKAPVD